MLVVVKPHQVAQISWLFSNQMVAGGVVGTRGSSPSLWPSKLVSSLFSSLSAVVIEVRPVKMIEDFISFPPAYYPAGRES